MCQKTGKKCQKWITFGVLPEQGHERGLDDLQLRGVLRLEQLGQDVGDLGQVLLHLPTQVGQILDGLLPDVDRVILAQVQDRVQGRGRQRGELGEEPDQEL